MKTEKIIGIVWLIFGLLYLYQGFGYLYQYSTPGILWAFMIPIIIAYTKIVCGILSLLIGIKFAKEKSENNYLILPLTFLLIIYLTIDIIQYGISTIYYSGENILLLILIAISFHKLKTKIGIKNLTEKLKNNKVRVIGILILGFMPYVLAELTTYDFYIFLH
ncbi:hypothetical protein [Winogradskyella forsetii]|uniref:hypothetical protein n=1 Tax=Winogradskyella forsetii TaxID=2686077 RepID=UPI0015C19992|nr:hypothetical protein [Winogradskyella forsetii]